MNTTELHSSPKNANLTLEVRPTGKTVNVWDTSLPTMRERIAKGRIDAPTYGIYKAGTDLCYFAGLPNEVGTQLAEFKEHGRFESLGNAHRHLMALSDSLWNSK